MRVRLAAAVVVVLSAASGCASGVSYGGPGATAFPVPFSSSAARAAARDLLASWTAAHPSAVGRVIVPLDALLVRRGEWADPASAETQGTAFDEGVFEVSSDVAVSGTPTPSAGWTDGVTARVQVLAPRDAVDQAAGRIGRVQGLTPLVVTAAHAATLDLATSHGPATVPAWDLTIAGTGVHAVVVAADIPTAGADPTGTPGRDLPGVGAGVLITAVRVGTDGRTLTAEFIGAPAPATSYCGVDYTAFTVADERAIVLVVVAHPYDGPPPSTPPGGGAVACSGSAATRQASVTLDRPWADRPVLDLGTALAVPIA